MPQSELSAPAHRHPAGLVPSKHALNVVTHTGHQAPKLKSAMPVSKDTRLSLPANAELAIPHGGGKQIKFALDYARSIIAEFPGVTWRQLRYHNRKIHDAIHRRRSIIEKTLLRQSPASPSPPRIAAGDVITTGMLDALQLKKDTLQSVGAVFGQEFIVMALHHNKAEKPERDIYNRLLQQYGIFLTSGKFTLSHLREINPHDAEAVNNRQSALKIPRVKRLRAASILTNESITVLASARMLRIQQARQKKKASPQRQANLKPNIEHRKSTHVTPAKKLLGSTRRAKLLLLDHIEDAKTADEKCAMAFDFLMEAALNGKPMTLSALSEIRPEGTRLLKFWIDGLKLPESRQSNDYTLLTVADLNYLKLRKVALMKLAETDRFGHPEASHETQPDYIRRVTAKADLGKYIKTEALVSADFNRHNRRSPGWTPLGGEPQLDLPGQAMRKLSALVFIPQRSCITNPNVSQG